LNRAVCDVRIDAYQLIARLSIGDEVIQGSLVFIVGDKVASSLGGKCGGYFYQPNMSDGNGVVFLILAQGFDLLGALLRHIPLNQRAGVQVERGGCHWPLR
jgi:hypothetical protein